MNKQKELFRFQRFAVGDDQCGMKIGTDGVLLGAWASADRCKRILDIGTGCGLIALMLAQRTELSHAQVDAIEIEHNAASQAAVNVSRSPWSDRMSVKHQPLQNYICQKTIGQYDLCVCNPPFFQDSSPSKDAKKRLARHCEQLTSGQLLQSCSQLINSTGYVSVVLPFDQLDNFVQVAANNSLYPQRQTNVRPMAGKPIKRVLLEVSRQQVEHQPNEIAIAGMAGKFSAEYEAMTRHFHPRFAKT